MGGKLLIDELAKRIVEYTDPEYKTKCAKLALFEWYTRAPDAIPCDQCAVPYASVQKAPGDNYEAVTCKEIHHPYGENQVCGKHVACGRPWCTAETAPQCTFCHKPVCDLDFHEGRPNCRLCDVIMCWYCHTKECRVCSNFICPHCMKTCDGYDDMFICDPCDAALQCVRAKRGRMDNDEEEGWARTDDYDNANDDVDAQVAYEIVYKRIKTGI